MTALRSLVTAVAITALVMTVALNPRKPLVGPKSIWGQSRTELRMTPLYQIIKNKPRLLPGDAVVGTVFDSEELDYPLFGERLTRTIIPLVPRPDKIDGRWLDKVPYRHIVVHWPMGDIPRNTYYVLDLDRMTLIVRIKQ